MICSALWSRFFPLSRSLTRVYRVYTATKKHLEPPIMSLRPIASLAVSVVLASSAFAQQSAKSQGSTNGTLGQGSQGQGHSGAPEIDAALTGVAAALVLGGVFIFTTARRKKLAAS